MPLTSETHLGPYKILSLLGAGGMGEVYKAKDTRLDRIVAIKVLSPEISSRADLKQRFEREASAISKLNHPNICTLYDIGHQNGVDYLVMEYLEGETLAQRLAKGPLPVEQVLRYSIEIANALDKAHGRGIIHRDLKPSNIMITASGTKLLDFGLAKLQGPKTGVDARSEVPTESASLTVEGTILGTFQYMAPEQLEGKKADTGSDLFALGAVIYEMVTGKKAFEGKSHASLIAAILEHEPPPVRSIQPKAPPLLDHILKRCLAKDPEQRWSTAHDLVLELKWIAEGISQGEVAPAATQTNRRERLAWTGVVLALLIAVAFQWKAVPREPGIQDQNRISFVVLPPGKDTFVAVGPGAGPVTISPDGKRLAFVTASSDGKQLLWVRALDQITSRPYAGTDGASFPFWSPDSRFVGFFAAGKLKKVEVSGSPPQVLCEAPLGRGGTWNNEGTIVFAPGVFDSLYKVQDTGGVPVPITKLDSSRGETTHRWPYFLPDFRHFVYFSRSIRPENQGIYLSSLDEPTKSRLLISARSNAIYASPGYVLFVREGTLMAQPFDLERLQTAGEAFAVVEEVGYDVGTDRGVFSVSEKVLAYGTGSRGGASRLVWVDRRGKELGTIDPPDAYLHVELSPTEKEVALELRDPQTGNPDLWLFEFSRRFRSRFTFDTSHEGAPLWYPDASQIVFFSNRQGAYDLYQKISTGAGKEQLLLKSDLTKVPSDCSPDGRYTVYQSLDRKTKWDLWLLPNSGGQKPTPLAQTEFDETHAQISSDGRWLAYVSNQTGVPEIYVQSFPVSSGQWQVSTGGGTQPRWRRDGKELFYLASDRKLMAVALDVGTRFQAGLPKPLFEARTTGGPLGRKHYDATGDGQRFLLNSEIKDTAFSPFTVIVNWTAALPKK